jgi:hypothetical protein
LVNSFDSWYIITLAIFPYLTNFSYNRLAKWRKIAKAPAARELTPTVITQLTQLITEKRRAELLKLRAARLGQDDLGLAVVSTTSGAYGKCLTDACFSRDQELPPLERTIEVIVYTHTNHSPVYYRTFPRYAPDSRSLDDILNDLDRAGFPNLVLITDRSFETLRNLEDVIIRGRPIITPVNVSQKEVAKAIEGFGEFLLVA